MSRSHRRPRVSQRLVQRGNRYERMMWRAAELERYDVAEYELVDAAWWGWGLDPCMRRRTWTKRLRRKVAELRARYCGRCGGLRRQAPRGVWCKCTVIIGSWSHRWS